MHYVYMLRSEPEPGRTYVGYSQDVRKRLETHNAGGSPHTAKHKPWQLAWYCAFNDKHQALAFETYLKSHSGKAFSNKRLIASPCRASRGAAARSTAG